MKTVYLGLGSNVGDRHGWLEEALRRLDAPGLRITRVSSVYETEPVDYREQAWFLNAVAEAQTALFPRMLLRRVLEVERAMGRRRLVPKGPRTIDIDILLYGRAVIEAGDLTVPHPRMHERRFVLEPLLELMPDGVHPALRQPLAVLLAKLDGQAVRRTPVALRSPAGDTKPVPA
ncbi:MAG: 2-amino-4-hydroxy-6-hydroxymethyldihydropteridine diphosphokinase [Bryobacterales bacterium]|nr:2-amino-4-hydroxy-6-hydroxymethyldihydropteridine diphosphokinase [Bryobacterales bacterium]